MTRPLQFFPGEDVFQLYSIHGIINGEVVPLAMALLRDKRQETYEAMFACLRDAVAARHGGDIGMLRYARFHFDFELASRNAAIGVFGQGITVFGCLFHYAQALKKHIQNKGLIIAYRNVAPLDGPQYQTIKSWVRRLVGMAMLPPQLVRWVWDGGLRNPPQTNDPIIDAALLHFRQYYERQWLRDDARINSWNHFFNQGPRTNNHVEGFNRSLREKFSTPRMKLETFMMEYQQHLHNASQIRIDQLLEGLPPKVRVQFYVHNVQRIEDAKRNFDYTHGNYVDMATAAGEDPDAFLLRAANTYISHCGNLIGGINDAENAGVDGADGAAAAGADGVAGIAAGAAAAGAEGVAGIAAGAAAAGAEGVAGIAAGAAVGADGVAGIAAGAAAAGADGVAGASSDGEPEYYIPGTGMGIMAELQNVPFE